MAAGSFTADQIHTFRQIYRERSDTADGGLLLESFAPAVEACLLSAGIPRPPSNYLDSEFRRLSTTGTVPWQQFFQVTGRRTCHVYTCVVSYMYSNMYVSM